MVDVCVSCGGQFCIYILPRYARKCKWKCGNLSKQSNVVTDKFLWRNRFVLYFLVEVGLEHKASSIKSPFLSPAWQKNKKYILCPAIWRPALAFWQKDLFTSIQMEGLLIFHQSHQNTKILKHTGKICKLINRYRTLPQLHHKPSQ